MAYRIFDHTADLGVEVTAATRGELYAEAAAALFDLMVGAATVRAAASREISVAGADAADLLVNFLRELLAVYYGDGFLLKACRVSGIDSRSLSISIYCAGPRVCILHIEHRVVICTTAQFFAVK